MAYTRAAEVAKLIRSVVVDGVAVSTSKRSVFVGVEIVVKGFRHDPEGLSRSWLIELFGASSIELDLTIHALRKLGFVLSGSSPEMKGRLTQTLTKAERRSLEARKKEKAQAVTKAKEKAEITAETLIVKQDSDQKIKALAEQIIEIRQDVDDITLIKPKGERGRPGETGADGKDGDVADLAEAELSNIGDVSEEEAANGQVLTWRDGQWCPRAIPSITSLASGGGGGGGSALELRQVQGLDGPVDLAVSDVKTILFDNSTGFFLTDKGDGEVFIELGSSFKTWFIDGQTTLIAAGEDEIELVAGQNIELISTDTHTGATAKAITISGTGPDEAPLDGSAYMRMSGQWQPASIDELNDVDVITVAPVVGQTLLWDGSNWVPGVVSGGGIADAPIDGNAYVRISGAWRRLSEVFAELVDAGSFATGETGAINPAQLDGGDYSTGASEAGMSSGQQVDGGVFTP